MVSRKLGLGSLIALAVAALTLGLSAWQWQRADEKRNLMRTIEMGRAAGPLDLQAHPQRADAKALEALDQTSVNLSGHWLPSTTLYLDNRLYDGRPGVQVITAFKLTDGAVAWVNRGWAPKPPGDQGPGVEAYRQGLMHPPMLSDRVTLEAVAYADLMQRLTLSADVDPTSALWTNLDWDRLRGWARARSPEMAADGVWVWPLVFWQTSGSMDGLIRHLPQPPDDAVDKHVGYALQWLLFCGVALFFAWRLSRPESQA
ncbi:MAG: hypothetical protein RLZZ290_110 [Pseudomonadota bacterium]|jgi:cytochrome oxidase assembly protein ShyY1